MTTVSRFYIRNDFLTLRDSGIWGPIFPQQKFFNMNTILVPTSLSQSDRAAFRYAIDLAMHYEWGLHLVYIWPVSFAPGGEPIFFPEDELEKDLEEFIKGSDLMHKELDFLGKTEFKKTVIQGLERPTLLGYADEIGASLIVVGNPKKSGIDRAFFGSLPADLARFADCPVLLVPERAAFTGFGEILFATDNLSLKPVFLGRAVDLANEFKGFIRFLHVGSDAQEGEKVQEKLIETFAPLSKPSLGWAWNHVAARSVERGLLGWLLENPADLVVLSTRHRSFLDGLTHHSVTEGLSKKPFFPVLVLHEEDPADRISFDSIKDFRLKK